MECLQEPGGQGRSNFRGAWDTPNAELDDNTSSLESYIYAGYNKDRESICLPVPYLAILPSSGTSRLRLTRNPFTHQERAILIQRLGGLWTVPPDDRLDLQFQYHVLGNIGHHVDMLKHINTIQSSLKNLYDLGGSLEVTEFGDVNNQYTYQPFELLSASDVEEWFLNIPPKLLRVNVKGIPLGWSVRGDTRLANQWKRTVYGLPYEAIFRWKANNI